MRAWVNGALVDAALARISVFDRGFRVGEGVFETLRAYHGHPFRLQAHLDRAAAGAAVLGFGVPASGDLATAIIATAGANHAHEDAAVRLTVTPGEVDPLDPFAPAVDAQPTVVVTSHPLRLDPDLYRRGVIAAVVPWGREVPQVKAVSYLAATLARHAARAQGADEALLTDSGGLVLEGSYSNVFAVRQGVVVTPPLDAGILPGVTRAVTMEVAAAQGVVVEQRPLTVDELVTADEAFLTASTREIVPLVRVGEHVIADGAPGPVTVALHAGYRAEVRREMAASALDRAQGDDQHG